MSASKHIVTGLCIVLGLVGAWMLVFGTGGLGGPPTALAEDARPTRPSPSVEVMRPYRDDIKRVTRVVAHVDPLREALIYSMVTGVVLPDPIEEGTRVDPDGDTKVLCTLKVPDLDADVATAKSMAARAEVAILELKAQAAQARQGVIEAGALVKKAGGAVRAAEADRDKVQAQLDFRQVVFTRISDVHAKSPNVVSQDEVDEAKGMLDVANAEVAIATAAIDQAHEEVNVANARVETAKERVKAAEAATAAGAAERVIATEQLKRAEVLQSFATITSPIKGVVAERMIDTGTLVKDGGRNSGAMPLFRVINDDELRIWFSLAAPDAPYCRPGNDIVIHFEEIADPKTGAKPLELSAKITRVTDALDKDTRTMKAEVQLANPKGPDGARLLRAGMFARAEVSLETRKNALILPTRAVQTRKHKSWVMVVRPDGTVNKVSVEIGADDGHRIQILEGVTESDQVIIKGMGLVADGEKAVPVEKQGGKQ